MKKWYLLEPESRLTRALFICVFLCCMLNTGEGRGAELGAVDDSDKDIPPAFLLEDELREKVVDTALRFIDTQYRYGGSSYETGVRGRRIDHVGLFIGDEAFVHANRTGGEVRVSSLQDSFWKRKFACARRLLPD